MTLHLSDEYRARINQSIEFRGTMAQFCFNMRGVDWLITKGVSSSKHAPVLVTICLSVLVIEYILRFGTEKQGRAGQDRTGQDGTEQDRTGQGKTGRDRTEQDRTGQDQTGRDGTKTIVNRDGEWLGFRIISIRRV